MGRVLRSPVFWLAVVAVAFTAGQLVLLPLRTFPSWDETVYASRFARLVATVPPSPHRAPGMALLLAPVTAFTASFEVVRGYLTVLSAFGLFLAYRVWVPVDGRVAALGALLFALLGEALLIAHMALPNYTAAVGAIAVTGFFVRAGEAGRRSGDTKDGTVRRRPWPQLAGLAGWLGMLALVRPSDAILLAAALAVAIVLAGRWRRLDLAVAVLAGLTVGGVGWLVEALTRFGGPLARLRSTQDVTEAGPPLASGWLTGLRGYAAAYPWTVAAGALAVVVAVTVAVLVARRAGRLPVRVWLVTLLAAGAVVVPYYFALSWSTARYELPAQALLTVVAAAVLVRLATAVEHDGRVFATAAVIVAVLAYGGWQVTVARTGTASQYAVREIRRGWTEQVRAAGVAAPCVTSGYQAPAFAYALGCRAGDNISALPSRDDWRLEFDRDRARAARDGVTFVAVLRRNGAPAEVDGWRQVRLGGTYTAYITGADGAAP